jgi:DNA polymerase III delta subunit
LRKVSIISGEFVAGKPAKKKSTVDPRAFLKEHTTPGPILLLGADRLRREEFCKTLFKQWGADIESRDSVKQVAAKSLPNKQDSLRDTFCSISLFSSNSLFLVRDAETLTAAVTKILAGVLDALPAGVGVVLVAEKLPGNSALKRNAAKKGWLVELSELETSDISKWAIKTMQRRGIADVHPRAMTTLVEISNGSIDSLNSSIEHLALYLNASKESPYTTQITNEDILKVFIEHPDPDQFKLIDTVLAGNPAQIECQIRSLAAAGKSEFLLLGLISRAVSQYLLVHNLKGQGKPEAQIRSQLKLPAGIASKVIRSALKVSPEKLRETKQLIVRTDSLFKNKSLGGEVLLDNLCHFIAS